MKGLELGLDVIRRPERVRRAGEVRLQGEVTEVGGDGVVRSRGEKGIFVVWIRFGGGGDPLPAAEGAEKAYREEKEDYGSVNIF